MEAPLAPQQLQMLLKGPAEKPPPGVLPDFNDPSNLHEYVIITLTLCMTFSTVAFLLRMYTKAFLIRSVAYEDYIIIIAWIGQVAEEIPSHFAEKHGAESHMWNIRLESLFRMLYWVNLTSIVYCPVVFFIKLSILLQYLRIFVPTRRGNLPMFIGIQICIWSCFILYVVNMAFEIAMCKPREKIWHPYLPGHCFDNNATLVASGIFNVISDFAILFLPMPALWRLQMATKKKLLMMAVFATGFLACIASILRTIYSWKVYKLEDVSYNLGILGMWAHAELAIGIIVSCMPVLPKCFQYLGPKIRHSLSFVSKAGSKIRPRSLFNGSTVKDKQSSKGSITLASHTGGKADRDPWINSINVKAHNTSDYITLDDWEIPPLKPPKAYHTNGITESQTVGTATLRDDIETGHGIGSRATTINSSASQMLSNDGQAGRDKK